MTLNETHFAKFRECYPTPPQFGPDDDVRSPAEWLGQATNLEGMVDREALSQGVNRATLIAMRDTDIGTLDLCIAILAWGGMHRGNRDHLLRRDVSPWVTVADETRNGDLTREQAFDKFVSLNHDGKLVGMRSAYFTKLIYFLMPRSSNNPVGNPVGYIMDQWLGCSINLLFGEGTVMMDSWIAWANSKRGPVQQASSQVSKLNTGKHYERFCQAVELIADRMGEGWTPDQAELALLGRGGHDPSDWRAYVKDCRLKRLRGRFERG